ncbi:MAG: hypothetical protein AB9842_00110 [Bacteroidales bacterium]
MKKYTAALAILFLLITFHGSLAQNISDSSFSAWILMADYSYDIPGGDLAKRFGANSDLGGGLFFKTQSNWLFGVKGGFLFGEKVKEDNILANISSSENYVIDKGGTFADIFLYERGYYFTGNLGRIIPLGRPNPNSGILINLGGGYLQHKIRIENPDKTAPQVEGDYKKGYDRLTAGFMASQFIGYIYFSNKKIYNFYAGLEFKEGWTHSLREYNFDTRIKDTQQRFDLLWGFKIGWCLPFYKKTIQTFYYY